MHVWCFDRVSRAVRASLEAVAAGAIATGAIAAGALAAPAGAQDAATLAQQWAEYEAVAPKSIVQLQPFRKQETATSASGEPLSLVSLAPEANAWFLLTLGTGNAADSFHLENTDPKGQSIDLLPDGSLALTDNSRTKVCKPWEGNPSELDQARQSRLPFAAICDGALYLRNHSSGAKTWRESVTDFLRHNIWGGDQVVQFVKSTFYRDAFAETDPNASGAGTGTGADGLPTPPLSTRAQQRPAIETHIDFGLAGTQGGKMNLGSWYAVAGVPGIYASVIRPESISADILNGPGNVNRLDSVESRATDYLVAFDLSQLDIGYAVGTEHPALNWSPRAAASVRPRGLPGPDGFSSAAPLIRLGMVSPNLSSDTVATFTGGFKREHAAFKWGPFSTINEGTHYGFVEQGVVFSKLYPGLSTFYQLDDGTLAMRTWTAEDTALLPHLRFARQNGVPLIVPDPTTGQGVPGPLVNQWGAGNWSGSAEAALRTLRAGACMIQTPKTRYLVYGYFSTATPSAMARVFQAYGCQYAMLLDMNAPELTYLAVYARSQGKISVEHLIPSMSQSDQKGANGTLVPRFLGFPDSRDFFYLTRKR